MSTSTSRNYQVIIPLTPKVSTPVNAQEIAQQWISALETILRSDDLSRLSEVFHEDSWWRDVLALQWDVRAIQNLDRIKEFVYQYQPEAQLSSFRLQDEGKYQPILETPFDGLTWVVSMIFFETKVGRGAGAIHLTQDNAGAWKAYTLYTSLQELKGFEEPLGSKRVSGSLTSMLGERTWPEQRQRQLQFLDQEPTVLVVGAGHSGLNIGARLQSLGLSCLIIDRNERVGDNWRKRYRTLVTHDPVEYTHLAYLPFPKNWPQFTPKDKLADWLETYVSVMELNVWTSTNIKSASYDDVKSEWTVVLVQRDGSERIFHPHHLVWCTGHAGEPYIPSFPGQEDFKGQILHVSQYKDASTLGVKDKKVVVVGTGNSGHDIAQDFYENGANVVMVQRSPTYIIQANKGIMMMHEGTYNSENAAPTEQVDIIAQSLPTPITFGILATFTQYVSFVEKDNIEGLEKAGFKIGYGIQKSGIFSLYLTRGGGYYIDVGCSQLIIDGKIKVKRSPEGISGFKPNSIVLKDGTELEADFVLLATGYGSMRSSVRQALGDKVADRCRDVWDVDEEGELNAIWRPSGHPNFWFFGGNLALCRIYSKALALQIKAIEEGLTSTGERSAPSITIRNRG